MSATVYPHCQHCQGHGAPWYGSETLTPDGEGHTTPCQNCQDYGPDAPLLPCCCPEAHIRDHGAHQEGCYMVSCPRSAEPHSLSQCLAAEHERSEG